MKAQSHSGLATLPPPVANGAHADTHAVRSAAFAWEDWFRQATTAQQAEALVLAQRQGYVYAHQLPAPANGAKPHPLPSGDGLDGLRNLLAGKTDALAPSAPRPLIGADASLTAIQRQAAFRLVSAPDYALLRTRPGLAAPVLAEIVTQAARAGERVLFLAQQSASVDLVLQKLLGRDAVLPVRFLDAGESVAQMAPPLRAFTLEAQRQFFRTSTLAKAQTGCTEAEELCRRRQEQESLWDQFTQLAERHAALDDKRQALLQRIADTPADVRREAEGVPNSGKTLPSGPFTMQIVELLKSINNEADESSQSRHKLQEQQTNLRVDLAKCMTREDAVKPLVEAKRLGRWWTGAWWRATLASDLPGRVRELEVQRQGTEAALAAVAQELQQCDARDEAIATRLESERVALIAAESDRRRQAWAQQRADIENELGPLGESWQALCAKLEADLAPTALTAAAIAEAQARWSEAKRQDEAACVFARQWAGFLQESAPHFVAQLPRYASLLAGTTNALVKNPEFAAFADGPFDLVIIEDAGRLLENDLLRLARKARRCLFVGHIGAGANGRPTCFDKLWQALHADPAVRLAYRWGKEGERWFCQLLPVAPKDRPFLETERLADFPEVELRILALPRAQPHLAQVVFPAAMTLAQAKTFIHRELEEAAVQPAGRGAWLEEGADAWTLHLGPPAPGDLVAIELEAGVREWVSPQGLTYRLDFAKTTWQHSQVDGWMRQHLNLRDLGRTFELV